MNTSGWIRGYIAHNSPVPEFISFVCKTIEREFGFEINILSDINKYILSMDKYKIEISKEKIYELQKIGPYAFDKYIFESLITQGFCFDKNRSQYIRYCYGIIKD